MTATSARQELTLADLTANEREQIDLAFHEAGHAVAAVALGGVLHSAVVVNGRVTGNQGLTTLDVMPVGYASEIAYAGPWAQARWCAGQRPTQRELFAVLASTGCKDERVLIASGGTHTGRGVVNLITRCWPSVVRVAQQLVQSGEVHQATVLTALGITDGGGLTSVQLASLRSGFRTVPPSEVVRNRLPV